MSEIALVSARKSRLETDAKKGSKAAGTALKLANSPDIFWRRSRSALRWWDPHRSLLGRRTGPAVRTRNRQNRTAAALQCSHLQALIVVVVTYLTLIIGELVPKRIGMTAAESVELVARPMYLFSRIDARSFGCCRAARTALCA